MKIKIQTVIVHCLLLFMLVLGGIVSLAPENVYAAQGLTPAGPIGGTDMNQALTPPSGLYGGLVYGYVHYNDWYFDDSKGHPIDDGTHFGALGLMYVYDTKLFGGSVLSSMSIGYQTLTFGYNETALNPTGTYYDAEGLMDMYTDIFFWTRFFPGKAFTSQPKGSFIPYGLGIGGGLGMTWPTGAFDEDDPFNVGSNHYTFSPSIAATWTTPSLIGKALGDATQFSARVFYNHYTENEDLEFTNGALLSVDYAITQLSGAWQYGIQGNAFKQVSGDDLGAKAIAMGRTKNRTESINLGPIVQYNFLVKNKPYFAKAKIGSNVHCRNGADTILAVLVLGGTF